MKKRIIFVLLSAIAVLMIFINHSPAEQHTTLTGELGTLSEITLYGKKSSLTLCCDYIKKADSLFSLTNPESEISRINRGEDITPSADTAELLAAAEKYADADSFNPFAGALFELWDLAIKTEALPHTDAVTEAKNSGQKINLGAIAKGFITNKLVDILKEEEVGSALINLGGNIYAHGKKPTGKLWQIAVRSPETPEEYIGVLSVEDTAIVTSGDYERSFFADGERYHHIINPVTGYPAKSGLRSVTIITPDAELADVLSTQCFILGFESSKPLLESCNALAIFVTEDNKVFFSKALEDIFSFNNSGYSYTAF